jgi:hypothetical protein
MMGRGGGNREESTNKSVIYREQNNSVWNIFLFFFHLISFFEILLSYMFTLTAGIQSSSSRAHIQPTTTNNNNEDIYNIKNYMERNSKLN